MVLNGKDFTAEIAELDEFIDSQPSKDGILIAVLHKAQDLVGYLPSRVQTHIAHKLGLPSSKVYGVVTFYSFFTTVPKGMFGVNVCMGTACFVRGAGEVLDEVKSQLGIEPGQTTDDYHFSLDTLRCVGACGLAPVMSVNGKVYGRVKPEDVKKIIGEYKEKAVAAV